MKEITTKAIVRMHGEVDKEKLVEATKRFLLQIGGGVQNGQNNNRTEEDDD